MTKLQETVKRQHPDDFSLQRFLIKLDETASAQSSDNAELFDHLIECQSCRQRVDLMSTIRTSIELMQNNAVEVDDQIDLLIAGTTAESEKAAVRRGLQNNPAQLKSALHSLTHRKSMQRVLAQKLDHDEASVAQSKAAAAARSEVGFRWLETFRNWFDNTGLSQSVFASVIVVAIAISVVMTNQKPTVTQFEETAGLRIISQDAQIPGIGFFNNANVIQQKYSGVVVRMLDESTLFMNWPVLPDAERYQIKVQRFIDGVSETISQVETTDNEVELELNEPYMNVRFQWTLSGEQNDGSAFLARGGFAIDE